MAEKVPLEQYSVLVTHMVTALRKISLYPITHPVVVSSVKDITSLLANILSVTHSFSLTISGDGKILVDSQTVPSQGAWSSEALVPYLKKLNIESLTIDEGVTAGEVEGFLKVLHLDPEKVSSQESAATVFSQHGITHMRVDLFSYVRVKKGEESTAGGGVGGDKGPGAGPGAGGAGTGEGTGGAGAGSAGAGTGPGGTGAEGDSKALELLKLKIKEFSSKKSRSADDVAATENELVPAIARELKEKKKVGSPLRELYRKFLQHIEEKDSALNRLKDALVQMGCPVPDVSSLVEKIKETIEKKAKPRQAGASAEELERLQEENAALKESLRKAQEEAAQRQDVEALSRKLQEVSRDKEQVENVIRNMADGMVVVDPQGKILMVNQAAEQLLGISMKDVGKSIREVVKDEHLLTLVKSLDPGAAEQEKDIELISSDETKKVVRASSAVVADPNGKTMGMVTTLNDITKQRELDRMKSGFVASVSHELRTPLVAVQKSLGMMLDESAGAVSDTHRQFLEIADRNLKRLTLLINDVLDLAKLEAGKLQIIPQTCQIEKAVSESVATLSNWAKAKSLTLEKSVAEGIPDAELDPNRIIQVLNNLIGNAIKFTPEGGTIRAEAAYNAQEKRIEVSVIDSGIGISQEALPRLFERFYQIGERTSTDISGTGIGLAISKEIVELHGGRIWVESEHGHGSKFTFSLPLVQQKQEEG